MRFYREPELSLEDFKNIVSDSLAKYEIAFRNLAKENDKDKLKVIRVSDIELQVEVQKLGTYKFYTENLNESRSLLMQSPESGIHHYTYDQQNKFWKSAY